jgi:hypothetical protein
MWRCAHSFVHVATFIPIRGLPRSLLLTVGSRIGVMAGAGGLAVGVRLAGARPCWVSAPALNERRDPGRRGSASDPYHCLAQVLSARFGGLAGRRGEIPPVR